MTHSKNANVSLKQSDISNFIPGLVYYCGSKSNDAVLIPICVFMANKLIEQNRFTHMHYISIENWSL